MDRTDIFISYRRADVEFTQQLYHKLRETDRAVWVDWENLPPGVEGFSDEIQRGIEGADAFVCVLSPDYLQSEYCLMELHAALQLKKRVIPIVVRKFEPLPPPEGIGHINWIYFTPHAGQRNDFEDSFSRVIKALEADYEHAREHTRLLLRAMDWQRNDRNNSYLLKEAEIDKAERWQVAAVGKNPAPTELQGEYILASRAYQRRSQRRLTAIFGVLAIFAVVAAIFAWVQRNNAVISERDAVAARDDAVAQRAIAETQRAAAQAAEATAVAAKEEADEQRATAESERQNALISGLAAQSQLVQQRQLGILLALEAYNESEKKGEVDPAVQTALRSRLVDFGGLPVHSYSAEATFVQFSPDDRWLISSGNGIVQVSDLKKSLEIEPISLGGGKLSNIAISPDSLWLAGSSLSSETGRAEIHVWNLTDLQPDPEILVLPEVAVDPVIVALSFGSDRSEQYWLAAGLQDGSVYRWEVAGLPQSRPSRLYKDPSGRGVTAMAFSPDGSWLAVAFSSLNRSRSSVAPVLMLWEMQVVADEPLPLSLQLVTMNRLVFSGSGRWLAGSGIHQDQQVKFRVWDMIGITEGTFANTEDVDQVNDIAFSPNEQWVVFVGKNKAQVRRLPNLAAVELQGYRDIVLTARFDARSSLLATGDYNGQIHIWNTADFASRVPVESPERIYSSFDVKISALSFNSAGNRLAAAGDRQVRLWSFPETLAAPVRIAVEQKESTVLGNTVVIQTNENHLLAMDLSTDEPTILFETSLKNPITYGSSPDERYLLVTTDRQFEVWDVRNGELVYKDEVQSGRVLPSFTADSRWFVYAVYDQIFASDLQNPENRTTLSGNRKGSDIASLMTLDHLLISQSNSEILAWDTTSAWDAPTLLIKAPGLQLPEQSSASWIVVQQSKSLSVWSAADLSSAPIAIPDEMFHEIINDRWLVSSTGSPGNSQTHLWDLTDPDTPFAEFTNDKDYGHSPSGHWFYYYAEGILHIVDLSSPNPKSLALEESAPGPLFSADDQWMAVPSNASDAILLYQLTNDKATSGPFEIVPSAFSMSGRWLVGDPTEDNLTNALLIDITDPENDFLLTGHTGELVGKIFTPDEHSLLTYGLDGTIRIWNLEDPLSDPVVLPHEFEVRAVRLSENGQWLIADTSEAVYLWQWNIKDVRNLACRLVGRDLTPEEWRKYAGSNEYKETCSD